jgi:hypothetical protein
MIGTTTDMAVPIQIRDLCPTFLAGRCDGKRQIVCGACGASGHGNCFGGGRGAIEIFCDVDVCEGYGVKIGQLERAVIEACIELRTARGEYDGEPSAVDAWLRLESSVDALMAMRE